MFKDHTAKGCVKTIAGVTYDTGAERVKVTTDEARALYAAGVVVFRGNRADSSALVPGHPVLKDEASAAIGREATQLDVFDRFAASGPAWLPFYVIRADWEARHA